MTPDVGSKLRDLALECSLIRYIWITFEVKTSRISLICNSSKLRQYLVNLREKEGSSDESIATMNLFICLVSRYFDQTDLVDCDE